MKAGWVAALLAAAAAPAAAGADLTKASEGYTYFSRPGATAAARDADLGDCRARVQTLRQPGDEDAEARAENVGGALFGLVGMAVAKSMADSATQKAGREVNLENCMVVKGWRVTALDGAEATQVAALDAKAKAARLSQWVGAATPHGRIVRAFANDAALNEATVMFEPAKKPTGVRLDLNDDAAAAAGAAAPPTAPARLASPMRPQQVGGLAPGMGLVLVNVSGPDAIELMFERVDAPADGRPAVFVARPAGSPYFEADGAPGFLVAYMVPAGRWRLSRESAGGIAVSFCLGAPAFDLAAGEAVYAGAFDLGGRALGPDLDAAAARRTLPAVSDLPERLHAAKWMNGTTGGCEGAFAYSLEIPGQPFVEGYAMGSRAPAAAPVAGATGS